MTVAIKQEGLDINGVVQVTAVPESIIWIWSGAVVNIPDGYQLCDGTNGTPDLRNRFIVGAGGAYSVGDTGGSNSVTLTLSQLPQHTHPVASSTISSSGAHAHVSPNTNSTNNHSHPLRSVLTYFGGPSKHQGPGVTDWGSVNKTTTDGAHTHPYSISEAGDHTHTVSATSSPVGGGQSHENRPPYYALAFIMEVGNV